MLLDKTQAPNGMDDQWIKNFQQMLLQMKADQVETQGRKRRHSRDFHISSQTPLSLRPI